jgi:hypothetical protein
MKKRIIAIVLTFVLVLGLNVTSFADTTRNVTVTVIDQNNVQVYSGSVVVPTGTSSYTARPGETGVENYGTKGTAFDAVCIACTSVGSEMVQYMLPPDYTTPENRWGLVINEVQVAGQTLTAYETSSSYIDKSGKTIHVLDGTYFSLYIDNVYADQYATYYTIEDSAGNQAVSNVTIQLVPYHYEY